MKLALIGAGLIGGSVAAGWRAAGVVSAVTAFDTHPAALAAALARGIADAVQPTIADAVKGADLIVLAVPVGAMRSVLEQAAPHIPLEAVITDVGSTKSDVIAAARAVFDRHSGALMRRFVPGHPIAGRELPGVAHSDAGLFRGKLVVTTPLADTDPRALEVVERAWVACGARVERMDAAEHDRVFAAVSHLPHVLAFALVAYIAGQEDGERKFRFAGAGFRDSTRIAASSPPMWRDIALANAVALGAELRGYRALLDELQVAVDRGDAAALERIFDLASRTLRAHSRTLDAA